MAITYNALTNRAANVPVVVHHADGETVLTVNQKKKPKDHDFLYPLGTFRFEAGKAGWVEIRNEGTKGHVLIDAVQWLPN